MAWDTDGTSAPTVHRYNPRMHRSQDQRTLLGGLTARVFLARHWQKQPLLIRAACPDFQGLVTLPQLLALACRDDVRSRVVIQEGRQWQVEHGPFTRAYFRKLPKRGWTLLVHDVNHFLPQARVLLERFSFIGFARLDDLMISYAPPGAGVGPHFDSYDVFLLQGPGQRRWQISHQSDLALKQDAPLRLLRKFRPEQEWVMQPGDLLYLPPGWAHNGIALEACMTYSIGFRAPAWRDLAIEFLRYLEDRVDTEGMYRDPQLTPTQQPGRLAAQMNREVAQQMEGLRWRASEIRRFLGQHLTEPKTHVVFKRPQPALKKAAFLSGARREGLRLELKTQMLYTGALFFINGETAQVSGRARDTLRELADRRRLASVDSSQRGLVTLLYEWYLAGYLGVASGEA
jgi:50S ribosomal protein L16 3-hydroxylase